MYCSNIKIRTKSLGGEVTAFEDCEPMCQQRASNPGPVYTKY